MEFIPVNGSALPPGPPRIDEHTGLLEPMCGIVYVIQGLKQGEAVSVYLEQTSGNLDPFVALGNPSLEREEIRKLFYSEVDQAIAAGSDPLEVIPSFANRYFYEWDDDSGEGYDAAFEFIIPADGDYNLLVTNSPAKNETFGDYRLLIGVNAPGVLEGDALPTGDTVGVLDSKCSDIELRVQQLKGNLSAETPSTIFTLDVMEEGDIFYAFIETTSGDLVPLLVLTDFGTKPLSAGIPVAGSQQASLKYKFTEESMNNQLEIRAVPVNGTPTGGSYRLLVGIDESGVQEGNATPRGRPVIQAPIQVKVGIELDQITGVDQRSENYGVVANIWMEWTDPELAFSPDECNCRIKVYRNIDAFVKAEGERWPEFTLFNQQERRWTQNELIAVRPDGRITYYERFWVTLQAPDFNFKAFPFDSQQFYIRIDALYPRETFFYVPWDERTAVGSQLGEEEWFITDYDTNVTEIQSGENLISRYSFGFIAQRHITFYVLRILVPILIIIVLTWIPFLLTDYTKRADIAAANLLLFIAFNFTIANELPRLGYLTFLDTIIVSTFVISGITVMYNLYLRWLATKEQQEIAVRIDRVMVWVYPLVYLIILGITVLIFPLQTQIIF